MYLASPAAPLFIIIAAARLASEPNIVCMAASRAAGESLPSLSCKICAISDALFMVPLLLRTLIPYSFINFAALPVGADKRCSIVFRDVPASAPFTPASANAPSTAVVSCMFQPAKCACAPHCASPCVNGSTSVEDAAAAPASALAATDDLLADSPNAPIACTTTLAEVPSSMPEDAAKSMVAFSAPPLIWASVRPPLASSTMASPASFALNCVSAPIFRARLRILPIWLMGMFRAPAVWLMVSSKSAPVFTAERPSATSGVVKPSVIFAPVLDIFSPAEENLLPALDALLLTLSADALTLSSFSLAVPLTLLMPSLNPLVSMLVSMRIEPS